MVHIESKIRHRWLPNYLWANWKLSSRSWIPQCLQLGLFSLLLHHLTSKTLVEESLWWFPFPTPIPYVSNSKFSVFSTQKFWYHRAVQHNEAQEGWEIDLSFVKWKNGNCLKKKKLKKGKWYNVQTHSHSQAVERGQENEDKEMDCLQSLQVSLSFSESSDVFRSTCFPVGSPWVQSQFYDIDRLEEKP